jgi:Ca-activated chloride channel family protein
MSSFVPCRAVILALSLAPAILHPSSLGPTNLGSGIRPDLQAGITLVQIPVTVTDSWNRPVTDLRENNFRVFEDGVEQPIQSVSSEDTPVSVCILADVSASMGGKRALSHEAVERFLSLSNPQDRFCLIEFNEHFRLLADFPAAAPDILSMASWARTGGQTALLDAINAGLGQMKTVIARRKALLIISDGGDNRSRYTETEIRSAVREADVQVYAMGVVEPNYSRKPIPELVHGPDLLRAIADDSGGHSYLVDRRTELADAAQRIGLELRNQYVIHYKPTSDCHDGKYHEVVVKVVTDGRKADLRVAWRRGYYAPAD